ncbi:hypothetical protein E4U48_005134 [Claviceps purpurea]|nr:hypothetical protein E4U48_005134 [Claviceps purpurea]
MSEPRGNIINQAEDRQGDNRWSAAVAAVVALAAHACHAADANAWKSRSIYFAFTDRIARNGSDNGGGACGNLGNYCGGTFRGIQGKLDYIKGMGFDAIWISPIVANDDGGYHGYWTKDLYAVNPNFGTAQELKDLVNAAHSKGMFVMIDIVVNHVGPGPRSNKRPSPLDQPWAYHPKCDIDYNSQWSVENCQLSNLPDLNTQNPAIRKLFQDWIRWLVREFRPDGLRIDTVKHIEKDYWPDFMAAAGMYSLGEAFNGDPRYVAGWASPTLSLFNYPIFWPLQRFYQQKGSSQDLVDMHNQVGSVFPDAAALGTFIDNHDNARFLSQKNDVALLKNALTYVMLARGVPVVYYGTEQGYGGGMDPANREDLWRSGYNTGTELYRFLSALSKVRKDRGGMPWDDHTHLMVESTGYAWSRAGGDVIALTSNIGRGNSRKYCIWTRRFNGSWRSIFDGRTYRADGGGIVCVDVNNGEPVILVA